MKKTTWESWGWIEPIILVSLLIGAVAFATASIKTAAQPQKASIAMASSTLNIVVVPSDGRPDLGFQGVNVKEDTDGALHIYKQGIWIASFRPNEYKRWFRY